MPRIALYLRVSKSDGSQSTDNQRPEVEQLAKSRGDVVQVYEEWASAGKGRPVYDKMLREGRRGKFDVLVVWALDRFGRSMVGNLQDLLELDRVGVQVVSVRESWLDTAGPTRGLLVAIFSWVAEQERARLIERTKAGLATARRKGKRLGRPRRRVDVDEARTRLAVPGTSTRAVARAMGIPLATLQRALARSPPPPTPPPPTPPPAKSNWPKTTSPGGEVYDDAPYEVLPAWGEMLDGIASATGVAAPVIADAPPWQKLETPGIDEEALLFEYNIYCNGTKTGKRRNPTPVSLEEFRKRFEGRAAGLLPGLTTKNHHLAPSMQRHSQNRRLKKFLEDLGYPKGEHPAIIWEWQMGWPEGWTDTKPLSKAEFEKWLAAHRPKP